MCYSKNKKTLESRITTAYSWATLIHPDPTSPPSARLSHAHALGQGTLHCLSSPSPGGGIPLELGGLHPACFSCEDER
jgi:hypothetical protein